MLNKMAWILGSEIDLNYSVSDNVLEHPLRTMDWMTRFHGSVEVNCYQLAT